MKHAGRSLAWWRGVIKANDVYEQLEKRYTAALGDKTANTAANVERNIINKPLGEKKTSRFTGPVRVNFFTRRRSKLRDNRSISEKMALDSLVTNGILQDDSKKYVREVPEPAVEVGEPEETIITITPVEECNE